MSAYLNFVLKDNVIPPFKVWSSINIISETFGEQYPYYTLGLWPHVEYGNSSPRGWERITILFKYIVKWPILTLVQLTKNLHTSPNGQYQV